MKSAPRAGALNERIRLLWIGGVLLSALWGCTSLAPRGLSPAASEPSPPAEPGALFVADGAGNFQACSLALCDAIAEENLPLRVHTFDWSHGKYRILADQLGFQHAQEEGAKLALVIADFHREHPHVPIYLAAHSAGSSVAVAALEKLPPNLVQRVVLLAPSICADYDLRPALRNVGDAIYVHYSRNDWWYLGFATQVIGTQDRSWIHPASGRVGFRMSMGCEEDNLLIGKLRQRPWDPADRVLGNRGGHFGCYQSDFLKKEVLPYLRN